ncbi:MAG: AMIN domain-containing protein [Terriglobales bacterium]
MKYFTRIFSFAPPYCRGLTLRRRCGSRCRMLAVAILGAGVVGLGAEAQTAQPAKPASAAHQSSGAGSSAGSSPGADSGKIASILSFRIVQEKDGPAVEILSTKPLIPTIRAVSGPDRLVIDLPNARLGTDRKRIQVQADQISTLRADQFQQNPPIARVVVDLVAPRAFTWDAAGNRLIVHLGRDPDSADTSPFKLPTVVGVAPASEPVVSAVRAAGPISISGNSGPLGSTITAGADTTVLSLSSGGEVRVCPGTTVSITPSQNRHNLMLSMNTGALEAHFALDASSDSVITPDFRILLVGPGEFHYAISADSQGNTCMRSLPGNTASAIVSELLGDRTYQVKATDQLVFRAGQFDRVDMAVPLECGCPPPREAPMRAATTVQEQAPSQHSSPAPSNPVASDSGASNSVSAAKDETAAIAKPGATTEGAAASSPNELKVQVEAPLVFHATGPPPAPVEEVRALPLDSRAVGAPALAAPLPPATEKAKPGNANTTSSNQKPSRGFFKRLGGFFASLFH